MAKFIRQAGALTIGEAGLGHRTGVAGSVRQQVHDGDTINVKPIGNVGVRFLGVDAPEISFMHPVTNTFLAMYNQNWENYLVNCPGQPWFGALSAGLQNHLQAQIQPGVAQNQHHHASLAEDALEAEVENDMQQQGLNQDTFRFFFAFAHEVMDIYGRVLCYINRFQSAAAGRPDSYNERLLQQGLVIPYFIWPNINPFRRQGSKVNAVLAVNTANNVAKNEPTLNQARQWVQNARAGNIGIFDAANPLMLMPFEVRFLARQGPPSRWVIDLSQNNNVLVPPEDYYTIPNVEDRLFIPQEYVPLFRDNGWQ